MNSPHERVLLFSCQFAIWIFAKVSYPFCQVTRVYFVQTFYHAIFWNEKTYLMTFLKTINKQLKREYFQSNIQTQRKHYKFKLCFDFGLKNMLKQYLKENVMFHWTA